MAQRLAVRPARCGPAPRPAHVPSTEGLRALLKAAAVPVWLPWLIPLGWLVTGFTGAGDDRSGTRGCVVALSGPSPVGGLGECWSSPRSRAWAWGRAWPG